MQSSSGEREARPASGPERSEATPGTGRALVLLSGGGASAPAADCVRPRAAFLAHLIATARRLPQTRERRRGSVGDALALYRSGATPPPPGTPVSRSV
ncbi:MAG: hypothetical protein IT538_13575 [Variibacter sp.]|nr:hypothetical protein [Variibacter sp.]